MYNFIINKFMKILLIEDNVKLNEAIKTYLSDSGFDIDIAFNAIQGINKIKDDKKENIFYDIIILDRMMPMKDGIEAIKEIKDISPITGIIMLTAKDTIEDKVAGLSAGADDYMIKPFDIKELIARIHSLYRRLYIANINNTDNSKNDFLNKKIFNNFDFIFDLNLNKIEYKNKVAELTTKESKIFDLLLKNKNQDVSKDNIFENIWHQDIEEFGDNFNPRQIDVHVHNLRNKLEEIKFPGSIETIRGVGYKLIL